jgi:beta-glucosidase
MKGRTYRYMSDPFSIWLWLKLSSSFSIGKAQVNKNKFQIGEMVDLKIPVLNTGKEMEQK